MKEHERGFDCQIMLCGVKREYTRRYGRKAGASVVLPWLMRVNIAGREDIVCEPCYARYKELKEQGKDVELMV